MLLFGGRVKKGKIKTGARKSGMIIGLIAAGRDNRISAKP